MGFGECKIILDNEFGLGFWVVDFPKSNVEKGTVTNIILNFDVVASRIGFNTVGNTIHNHELGLLLRCL